MTILTLTPFSATTRLYLKPPVLPQPPTTTFLPSVSHLKPPCRRNRTNKKFRERTCRAELAQDAPFAAAIGACMLSSLVFTDTGKGPDDDTDSAFDMADTRLSVMGIISFIPYFNWLSWVFAWLDTGKRRYAVYALVYLAPYLRFLLISLEILEWFCFNVVLWTTYIISLKMLETSIKNGDIQGFQLFSEAAKHLSSMARNNDHSKGHEGICEEGKKAENFNLPSGEEESRNDTRKWDVPRKRSGDREYLNEDWYDDERKQ